MPSLLKVPLPPLPPNPLGRRVKVPLRLEAVTTTGDEVAPDEVGMTDLGVGAIWAAATALYRTGLHPGLALVVRRQGQVVLNRALGHRTWTDGDDDLMAPDTAACLYSGSKAVTALVLHKLAEDGLLSLDDPVAAHLPEFAANGKEAITLRDLLSHRAGLERLPVQDPDPELLFDWDAVIELLCQAEAHLDDDGVARQAYHAITAGYVVGEVAQRVSGESLRALLDRIVRQPLGLSTMTYGVPADQRGEVALGYTTGAVWLPPLTQAVQRILGYPPHRVAKLLNRPEAMDAVIPAGGIYASAADAALLLQALLHGGAHDGRRVLAEETVAAAVEPAGPIAFDGSMIAPIRFSAGFMLGERVASLYGVNAARAFGHLGYSNVLCWADPDRDLAAALITTGKSIAPEGFLAMLALSAAVAAAT